MEESYDMTSDEDKVPTEKNNKRRLKTPSQVEALEKFYNEHKYPSESMKSQLASEIGLSEKQVSGWFCHRRLKDKKLLKDEAYASEKQDLSNGIIMHNHRSSRLRHDSCSSTKQAEYKHFDPKEVESRNVYSKDHSAAALVFENRGRYLHMRGHDAIDNTSSGSSSSSEGRPLPSRYSSRGTNSMLMGTEDTKSRRYMKSSGYLYLQDEIENPAISAVKRQLGRHYCEDGPPIGVEFQPLPPGAFESPDRDPIHEPYYIGEPVILKARNIRRVSEETDSVVYERGSEITPHSSSHKGGISRRTVGEFDNHDELASYHPGQRSFINYENHASDQNSAMETADDSYEDASELNSKSYGTWSKQRIEERDVSYKTHYFHDHGGKVITNRSPSHQRLNYSNGARLSHKSEKFGGKPTSLAARDSGSLDSDDKVQSRRKEKVEALYNEKDKEYRNPAQLKAQKKNEITFKPVKMARRMEGNVSRAQGYASEMPSIQTQAWENPIRRSSGELRASFNKEETESSSSMD